MDPTHAVTITHRWKKDDNGDPLVIDGLLMYAIVWVGKAMSGHEELIRGDDIADIAVEHEGRV